MNIPNLKQYVKQQFKHDLEQRERKHVRCSERICVRFAIVIHVAEEVIDVREVVVIGGKCPLTWCCQWSCEIAHPKILLPLTHIGIRDAGCGGLLPCPLVYAGSWDGKDMGVGARLWNVTVSYDVRASRSVLFMVTEKPRRRTDQLCVPLVLNTKKF
jgi:hypothetical protein